MIDIDTYVNINIFIQHVLTMYMEYVVFSKTFTIWMRNNCSIVGIIKLKFR